MEPENVHIGATVRGRERHRIAGRYGGNGYVAVDVRFSSGRYRLFRPEDLEEISPPHPWWRSLLNQEWACCPIQFLTPNSPTAVCAMVDILGAQALSFLLADR